MPLLFVLLVCCVEPANVKFIPEPQKLVVDGMITNAPGPYEVKLSYTVGFDKVSLKKPVLNSGASIWIYDDLNNFEKLSEVSTGVYQTSKTGMQGKVGRSYYLKIITKFGREYRSAPQKMEAPGSITNVSFKYQAEGVKGNAPDEYVDALKILLDSKGNESGNNLFRWRWNTIFEARTFPELRLGQGATGPPFPFPEPCSGYVANGPGSNPPNIRKVAECTCCTCWPDNYSTASLVSHNRIIDGIEFKEIDLGNIPAETQQFYTNKYYVKVEQLSISEDAYDFWNLVEKQQSGQGNLFQPNSVRIKGNIQSITDPNEEVLGLFGVSGITSKEMYITSDLIPHKLLPLDTIKHACSDSFKSVLPVKPSFW
jgi:hypothetical protein